jgi:hypothetical protein
MSWLAEREKRAREAILSKIIEDYKRQHPHWRNEPAVNKAALKVGLCCWQSFVLIGATILVSDLFLIIFRPIPAVALTTLLFGGIIELIFLYLGLQDDKRLTKAIAHLLAPQVVFTLDAIRDKNLKVKLYKALEYWSFMDRMMSQQPHGLLRDHLLDTTREVTRWLQGVYYLAEKIDKFRSNPVVQRDWQTLPVDLKNYEQKLSQAHNPEVRCQLERTIRDKQLQWQNLQKLQGHMEKAYYQLDSTIASLGTIYSQLLLISNTGMEGTRLRRVQVGIAEQVQRLEDLTAVMDEVYRQ